MEIFPRWHRYTRAQLGLPQLDVIPCRERSHLPPEKENHRFLKGDNMAGCLEGFFHGFENTDLLMRVVSHFYALVLGSWKQPKFFGRSFKVMRWQIERRAIIYLSDTQIWSIQNKSNDPQKPLKNPEGELWQTPEPHKSPGTIQQRKIRQNFTLTSADSFGSTKNQVPKWVRMVLVNSYYTCFFLASTGKKSTSFLWHDITMLRITSTIQDRISNRHIKDSCYLIYIVIYLVVSTHLKNTSQMSQTGSFPQFSGWNMKSLWVATT